MRLINIIIDGCFENGLVQHKIPGHGDLTVNDLEHIQTRVANEKNCDPSDVLILNFITIEEPNRGFR